MRRVSVVRLPVDDVDRRLIRQVMNKIRGEHDLFLDAEEYYRMVSEGSRDLIRELLNENDLRIDNLLRLREPLVVDDEELKAIAERFATKVERRGWTENRKGLILQFAFWLQKEGHANSSYPQILKRLVNNGANLLDPESVKEIIAKRRCKDATKILEVYAYNAFAKMSNIEWTKPHYRQEEILPFIPEERELDQLIAACKSRRMATFLQTLKETFADPGEVLKLRWTDLTGNVINIRSVKGHRPRQLMISSKLVAMLHSLPRRDERIFPTTYTVMNKIFWRMKNRVANITNNPRLKAITFTTFRHWGATMIYHQTRNLLLVQKILGHKRITSTMKYTQLIPLKEDEYDVTAATSIEEDQELLKTGFEYVTQRKGIKLYRRPKIFAKYMNKS
jgi:integrase